MRMLEPLGEDECRWLIRNLLGGGGVSTQTAASIARAAGGNPLFIEELIAELIDRRLLVRSDDRWEPTADLAPRPHPSRRVRAAGSPPGRLDVEERAVLERASVVGQVFDRQAVVALSPEPARPAVGHASPCWSADSCSVPRERAAPPTVMPPGPDPGGSGSATS